MITPNSDPHEISTEAELTQTRKKALTLIGQQRTMVLSTCKDQTPWAAPVYYVYVAPGFYFYSSPHSVHIRQALAQHAAAGVIFADGNRIEQIEGIQMSGPITPVEKRTEQVMITARFLVKFPMARPFLSKTRDAAVNLKPKVTLYRFSPEKVHYTDNRSGFGRRHEIELS